MLRLSLPRQCKSRKSVRDFVYCLYILGILHLISLTMFQTFLRLKPGYQPKWPISCQNGRSLQSQYGRSFCKMISLFQYGRSIPKMAVKIPRWPPTQNIEPHLCRPIWPPILPKCTISKSYNFGC